MASDPRIELERQLLHELDCARQRYRAALEAARKLSEEAADLVTTPDGTYAQAKATGVLRQASQDYRQALRRFRELILKDSHPA